MGTLNQSISTPVLLILFSLSLEQTDLLVDASKKARLLFEWFFSLGVVFTHLPPLLFYLKSWVQVRNAVHSQ